MTGPRPSGEGVFRGVPVSAGIAQGKVFVLKRPKATVPKFEVPEHEVPPQLHRFQQALVLTRRQILEMQEKVSKALNAKDASIFDAHLLVLDDPTLLESVSAIVIERRINVEAAFQEFTDKYTASLSAIDDAYLRERVADMRDVTSRIMANLLGTEDQLRLHELREPCILLGEDVSPSDVATLNKEVVLGFATDAGSRTSHAAIMARSLGIPAVVGLKDASAKIKTGTSVLLDGYTGSVIVNPTDQTRFAYGQMVRRQASLEDKLREIRELPAITLDGKKIVLSGNIEQAGDGPAVKAHGGEGVGLFRTEFLFVNRSTAPTENEQYEAYRRVAEVLRPDPVIIRTLDLGGDKYFTGHGAPQELNPFLGWRAIRLCLEETALFRSQLRAILRASAAGNVKMMYPMISGAAELDQANALVERYKAELRAEKIPFDENLEIGAMIEIPSAAIAADTLAGKVKFFSIGTNDLIQYTLAVDRLNERIAYLYEPTHPAVLRLIKSAVDAAARADHWCGVCGEMAGDPVLVPLLLGLGVGELSVSPPSLPRIKFLIRRLKLDEARELAGFALTCGSAAEILERARTLAKNVAPSLFESEN